MSSLGFETSLTGNAFRWGYAQPIADDWSKRAIRDFREQVEHVVDVAAGGVGTREKPAPSKGGSRGTKVRQDRRRLPCE